MKLRKKEIKRGRGYCQLEGNTQITLKSKKKKIKFSRLLSNWKNQLMQDNQLKNQNMKNSKNQNN